jgi:hypothetical protein
MALPRLYELAENYRTVWDLVSDDDADMETLEDTLQSIEANIEVKAQNIAAMLTSLSGYTDTLDAQIKRLQSRKKAFENRQASIKQYLQYQLEAAGIDKVKTAEFTIALQNNPAAVVIEDQSNIPATYLTIIPEQYIPDKAAIKKAIQAGVEVPGCRLAQGKSIRIR